MLKGLQWPLWLSEAWYNKWCIHCLANTCHNNDFYQMFGACCLCSWIKSSSGEGGKVCYLQLPCFYLKVCWHCSSWDWIIFIDCSLLLFRNLSICSGEWFNLLLQSCCW